MIRALPLLALALQGSVWSTAAQADDLIHKCRDADGTVHYQDRPCPPGTAQPLPPIARDEGVPPAVAATPAATARAEPVPPHEPDAAFVAPPPALYRCTRYDGQESYVTEDPVPRRYQVPLWTIVGDAGAAGSAYTWVEDRCRQMSPRQQCEHWRARRSEVGTRRRQAFREELARLDAEYAALRAQLAAHCGG